MFPSLEMKSNIDPREEKTDRLPLVLSQSVLIYMLWCNHSAMLPASQQVAVVVSLSTYFLNRYLFSDNFLPVFELYVHGLYLTSPTMLMLLCSSTASLPLLSLMSALICVQ